MTPGRPVRVPDAGEAAEIVAAIVRRHADGEKLIEIARALGLPYHVVGAAVKGRTPRFDIMDEDVIVPALDPGPRKAPTPIKGTGGISDIVIADRR